MPPPSENSTLIWALVAVVIASLALSLIMLIQIVRRSRSKKQAAIEKAEAQQQFVPPKSPYAGNVYPQTPPYRAPSPGVWEPPDGNDPFNRTEALFSSGPQFPSAPGDSTEHLMDNAYSIYIRETSPENVRDYEITVVGELSVGRSAYSGLYIDHPTVSGTQCIIVAGPSNVFVSNKSNSNITQLNGVRVDDMCPLRPGDTLILGRVQLYLMGISKYASHR